MIYAINGGNHSGVSVLQPGYEQNKGRWAGLLLLKYRRPSGRGEGSIAPELAAALDRSAQEFRGFSEAYSTTSSPRLTTARQAGLVTDPRAVKEVVAQNRKTKVFCRHSYGRTSTAVERITQRLDDRFKPFAQPHSGIPTMQTLTKASQQLTVAVDAFVKADFGGGWSADRRLHHWRRSRATPVRVAEDEAYAREGHPSA